MYVSLADLQTVLAPKRAELLCKHLGGTAINVPRTPTHWTAVAAVLRDDELALFCREFGGQKITLPNGNYQPKKGEIIERLERGESPKRIALALGVTERWVRIVAAGYQRPAAVQCALPICSAPG